ncbi:hypothetical protein, partial [Micromonospora tarensis]|uniref:hypothetical protein n=1 Tax=Micromonospora tarensis TaxID=2806100 RepID=UPI001EE48C0A
MSGSTRSARSGRGRGGGEGGREGGPVDVGHRAGGLVVGDDAPEHGERAGRAQRRHASAAQPFGGRLVRHAAADQGPQAMEV